jgi:hypothetical protein
MVVSRYKYNSVGCNITHNNITPVVVRDILIENIQLSKRLNSKTKKAPFLKECIQFWNL